jgi:hypothetical protein
MKKLTLFFILLLSIKSLNAQKGILKTQQDTTDLKIIFESMEAEDQKCRKLYSNFTKSNVKDSIEQKRLSLFWRKTDSLNRIKLDSIGKIYGVETVSSIGRDNVFTIVQHGTVEMQLLYLPVFKKLNKEHGYITGEELALLEDRLLVRTLQKQIYGSQICTNGETKEQFVCALEDPDNLLKRRSEKGMIITWDEYCKHFNIKWDVEEYKKRLPEYEAIQKKQGKW